MSILGRISGYSESTVWFPLGEALNREGTTLGDILSLVKGESGRATKISVESSF